MNGLHDLLATIRKIEEADATQTYPQGNRGNGMNIPAANVQANTTAWTPTPEQATWLGKADQQDPYILGRMPGVKPPITHFKDPADQAKAKQMGFPATAPAVTPPAVTPPAVTPPAVTPPAVTPPTIDQKANEYQPKIDRLKTILGLNVTQASNATANTTGAPNMAQVVKESIVFKSRIGRTLLESFDIQLDEAGTPREEADALWAEISKAMETPGALTPEQRKDVENMTQSYQQFQQNNTLPNTQNPTTPTKPTAKGHPSIGKLQDFFNKKGATSNDGKPLTIDNLYGQKSSEAQDNFYKKYPGNAPERAELDAIIKAIPKEWSNKFVGNKTTPPPTIAQKANPKATADTGSPELDTTGSLANPPVAPGTVPVDQLTKAIPTPKSGDTYWINGNRYRYQVSGGGKGFAGSAKWVYDYGQEKPETIGGITSNQTTYKRLNKYTGIGESAGYSDDELSRLVSLVHHR